MEGFKSSESRLARLFLKSREHWKQNAASKQKKLRALEVKVRDLSISRDCWKTKAKEAQEEVRQLRIELSELKKNYENDNEGQNVGFLKEDSVLCQKPKGHIYPIYIMILAINQIIFSLCSFRGAEKTFKSLAEIFHLPTPMYSSIRKWTLRVGLYELQKKREYRRDWIFIIDTTIELGKAKCLVILGISQSKFSQITELEQRSLKHKDMEVLGLEVMSNCNGMLVEEKLIDLSERVGTPKQIVADRGSDIKKGIELYQAKNPEVIYTYDATHFIANLLKKELSSDKKYQDFVQECLIARQKIQQTELYFFTPPKQRSKARDNNLDIWVNWGIKILRYEEKNNFKEISDCFLVDKETLSMLAGELDKKSILQLEEIAGKVFKGKHLFRKEIKSKLESKTYQDKGDIICQASDLGRRKFENKLGWVKKYKEDLITYSQMLELVKIILHQLKEKGLTKNSLLLFEEGIKELRIRERCERVKDNIIEYLNAQSERICPEETLLASSDVLESILGKYKIFSSGCPLKEIGKMLLTIPLCTIQLCDRTVRQAMEKVRSCDVDDWSQKVLGPSMLSKRRAISKPI